MPETKKEVNVMMKMKGMNEVEKEASLLVTCSLALCILVLTEIRRHTHHSRHTRPCLDILPVNSITLMIIFRRGKDCYSRLDWM